MKLSNSRALERKLEQLRKRSPWMASLILHCLENQNPRSCETMRLLLARLRLNCI